MGMHCGLPFHRLAACGGNVALRRFVEAFHEATKMMYVRRTDSRQEGEIMRAEMSWTTGGPTSTPNEFFLCGEEYSRGSATFTSVIGKPTNGRSGCRGQHGNSGRRVGKRVYETGPIPPLLCL